MQSVAGPANIRETAFSLLIMVMALGYYSFLVATWGALLSGDRLQPMVTAADGNRL